MNFLAGLVHKILLDIRVNVLYTYSFVQCVLVSCICKHLMSLGTCY